MKNLFGDTIDDDVNAATKRGHAAAPGSGPDGETCGTCRHIARVRLAKVYRKCGLMKRFWTSGGGTDIRAKDPACKYWEEPDEDTR